MIVISAVTAEYKSMIYNGFNYTYAGDEVKLYPEVVAWCKDRGGVLPSVHSLQDIEFLADKLVGRHEDHEAIFLGASASPEGSEWQWYDGTPFDPLVPDIDRKTCEPRDDCCRLIMWTDFNSNYHKRVWATSHCRDLTEERRMVCKTPLNAPIPETGPTTTTESPFVKLTQMAAARRLAFEHSVISRGLSIVSDKVQLLTESVPNALDFKLGAGHVEERVFHIRTRVSFLVYLVFFVSTLVVLYQVILILRRLRAVRLSGSVVSVSDLLA